MLKACTRELRSRKAELYSSLLPREFTPVIPADIGDDNAYASYLAEVARLGQAGLGLAVGTRRRLSQFGALGVAAFSCATLREVSELWKGFGHGVAELVTFESGIEGEGDGAIWVMQVKPFSYLPREITELYESELLAATFAFIQELAKRDCSEFVVELTASRDSSIDYSIAFPGLVLFGREQARILAPASAIDWPVLHRDGMTSEIFYEQLGGQLTWAQNTSPMTSQIHQFLINRRAAPATLTSAAAALGLSKRTLVRKLADEGTTYGMLLDEYRQNYSLALAVHDELRAKQIAHLVGFRSENSLRRAFKKWTGLPIGAWIASSAR